MVKAYYIVKKLLPRLVKAANPKKQCKAEERCNRFLEKWDDNKPLKLGTKDLVALLNMSESTILRRKDNMLDIVKKKMIASRKVARRRISYAAAGQRREEKLRDRFRTRALIG